MKSSYIFCLVAAVLLTVSAVSTHAGVCKSAQRHSQSQINAKLVARGKRLFADNQCLDCHRLAGKGAVEGIDLDGVGSIRSSEFLTAQLEDPEKHVRETLHNNSNMMVAPNLTKDEVRAVVAYLKTLKKVPAPSATRSKLSP